MEVNTLLTGMASANAHDTSQTRKPEVLIQKVDLALMRKLFKSPIDKSFGAMRIKPLLGQALLACHLQPNRKASNTVPSDDESLIT